MLTLELRQALKALLIRHEGCKKYPCIDNVGKIQVGIGYNLSDRGLPDSWINQQYEDDVLYFYNQLMSTFDWYKDLSSERQIALIDMAFMGWQKFLKFEKMLNALAYRDYTLAADEILKSEWAEQLGVRARELAHIILTDKIITQG